ncbi:hypothetical protein [Yinghuangia soli]|uniref:Uncharacterized protein n=1 Tax=Yinghuangia soli TaxID=2908204 RepID=A0AA41U3E9_9ACTN|nr:hypothetical protein [Yinghuangia soli]MCF2531736.1 hypothetical protein [Yinghuangia soli]
MPDTTPIPAPTPITGTGVQQAPIPPAQAPAYTGATVVTAGSISAVLLGVAVWYVLKHKKAVGLHMLLGVCLGLALANSVIGRALNQVVASLVGALIGVTGSL